MLTHSSRSFVRNASDAAQVRRAERAQQRIEDRLRAALRVVMGSPEGRAVCWAILGAAGTFRSVYDADPVTMGYRAGRQDMGHELMADLLVVDEALYQEMERDERAFSAQVLRDTAGAQRQDGDR